MILAAIAFALFFDIAQAQSFTWPTPWKAGEPATSCDLPFVAVSGDNQNLCSKIGSTAPYSGALFKDFVGRFLDSTGSQPITKGGDYRFLPVRAQRMLVVPEQDRLYVVGGTRILAYKLSEFFGSVKKDASGYLSVGPTPRTFWWEWMAYFPGFFLPPVAQAFPSEGCFAEILPKTPRNRSGWWGCWCTEMIFADYVGSIDVDDRGYLYMDDKFWGFGITLSSINSPVTGQMELVSQNGIPYDNGDSPYIVENEIGRFSGQPLAFRVGNKRFVALSDRSGNALLDVTDPRRITQVTTEFPLYSSASTFAKANLPQGHVIAIANQGKLSIFNSEKFLANAAAKLVLDDQYYISVASNGSSFFALPRGELIGAPPKLVELKPEHPGDPGTTYVRRDVPLDPAMTYEGIHYGSGYLSVKAVSRSLSQGLSDMSFVTDIQFFKVAPAGVTAIPMSSHFRDFYGANFNYRGSFPKSTLWNTNPLEPDQYDNVVIRQGDKLYDLHTSNALGDVYELAL